jgi:hypothetical protein
MKTDSATLMVTYKGDISAKLKSCGTQCPFRVNPLGDTEQLVVVENPKWGASEQASMLQYLGGLILADCRENGEVLCHSWIVAKDSDGVQQIAIPLPHADSETV